LFEERLFPRLSRLTRPIDQETHQDSWGWAQGHQQRLPQEIIRHAAVFRVCLNSPASLFGT
jgi:hypothetical protein